MPISFPCPHCGKRLNAPELPGRRVRCPRCGESAKIPGNAGPDWATQPPEPRHPAPQAGVGNDVTGDESAPTVYDDCPPPSGAPGTKIAVAAIAGMGLLAILIVTVVAVNQPRPAEQRPDPGPRAERNVRQPPPREFADPPAWPKSEEAGVWGFICAAAVFLIAWWVGVILVMIFVAKDAKARGQDAGPMWLIVMLFLGVVGLLVYLASRPPGTLVLCQHCHNKRLAYAKICPHCGHE